MELRVLRNFLTVAREENITLAANLLHLTQPTLSRQIQDLEEELGHKLFQRKSHRVCLTEEGYRFRQRAEEIVALADQTLAEFAAPAGDLSGDVYIGCGETEVIHLLAEVAAQVQLGAPPGALPSVQRQRPRGHRAAGPGPSGLWPAHLPPTPWSGTRA